MSYVGHPKTSADYRPYRIEVKAIECGFLRLTWTWVHSLEDPEQAERQSKYRSQDVSLGSLQLLKYSINRGIL